jgi:hypothetical protein
MPTTPTTAANYGYIDDDDDDDDNNNNTETKATEQSFSINKTYNQIPDMILSYLRPSLSFISLCKIGRYGSQMMT